MAARVSTQTSAGRSRTKPAANRERVEVLISEKKLQAKVRSLGRTLTRQYRDKDLVLIGVLKGSFVFMADLVRHIRLPLTCDFIRVSSYGRGRTSSGSVRFKFDTTQSITGKHVLLVEDIIDTGRTMKSLLKTLRLRKPRSLKVCTLLHKPARQEIKVPIAFQGFTVPNEFVVGYGLDFAGRYRNLPHIGVLKT